MKLSPLKTIDYLGALVLPVIVLFTPLLAADIRPATTPGIISHNLLIPQKTGDSALPSVTAQGIYIYDPESKTVIYQKNGNTHFYPASTTKLMTALVSLDVYGSDQILTVKSGKVLGSSAHLKAGDKLTVENLLRALLINSGNDAAVVLADNYSKGYSGFIDLMNQKARDLGLSGTHFVNVSGLVDPDHFTTPHDLTIIAQSAVANALIRQIVPEKDQIIKDVSGKIRYPLESTNLLLGYDGVRGLKTGWTPESGECLVSLVTRNGHSIIVTVLKSDDRFGDSKQLIDWVYNNYSWNSI